MIKFGIKVMIAVDDWIWVTEDNRDCINLRPVLFDTKLEAERYARTWRRNKRDTRFVRVVEYYVP